MFQHANLSLSLTELSNSNSYIFIVLYSLAERYRDRQGHRRPSQAANTFPKNHGRSTADEHSPSLLLVLPRLPGRIPEAHIFYDVFRYHKLWILWTIQRNVTLPLAKHRRPTLPLDSCSQRFPQLHYYPLLTEYVVNGSRDDA